MRSPQQRIRRNQVSRTLTVPAPVDGINARDALAEMKPTDAIRLDNLYCTPNDVFLRNGYSQYATGMSGMINTLASYSPPTGTPRLFAAVGANIYDASAGGVVGAAVVSGRTSDKWQHTNFGTAGGNFLILVNGADKLQGYSGSAWWCDGDGTHDITGVDSAKLIHVCAHKSRLWFVEKDSLSVWYLAALSIGGAATEIDFSGLFGLGGYLVAMGSWSLDSGTGIDDYAAFITSEGQVAIYSGSDPASTSTWSLVGVFDLAAPIGRRCVMKLGGDLAIICRDGLAPLSKTLLTLVSGTDKLTDKVRSLVQGYTTDYGSLFGWETQLFPAQNMLLLNIPTSPTQSVQLVQNLLHGAWSRFVGWDAACFELHQGSLYFGGSGYVGKAWHTLSDNGSNINFEAQQAFSRFSPGAQQCKVQMVRALISTDGSPGLSIGVNANYDTSSPTSIPSFTPASAGVWDTAKWDEATWGSDPAIKTDWQTCFAIGHSLAAHILGACSGIRVRWAATDYLVEQGGVV